jgi:hypothetical protein
VSIVSHSIGSQGLENGFNDFFFRVNILETQGLGRTNQSAQMLFQG